MKILHASLCGPYNEGATYQDNQLPLAHKKLGHDVLLATTTLSWDGSRLASLPPCDKMTEGGVRLLRLPYSPFGGKTFAGKRRRVPLFADLLEAEAPDVIFFHGVQTVEVNTVIRYKKAHPNVKIYCDSHADAHNSARGVFAKLLHFFFYRRLARKMLRYVDTYLCVSVECADFLAKEYAIPRDRLSVLPLGGFLLPEEDYAALRRDKRKELGLGEEDILCLHTGKLDAAKRTKELLAAFKKADRPTLRLAIIGSFADGEKETLSAAVSSTPHTSFLGWKTGSELLAYLAAADLYLQPGSQSATLQNAACTRTAIAAYPHKNYRDIFGDTGIFFVESEADMAALLCRVADDPAVLKEARARTYAVAKEKLDYMKQAEKTAN